MTGNPHSEPLAVVQCVLASSDSLLLLDHARLQSRARAIQQRLRRQQPTDQLLRQLEADFNRATHRWQRRAGFRPTVQLPAELPIAAHRENILAALARHQVIIVSGDTGSGKTTQLPKLALLAGRGRLGRIGVTQPRRLAAVSMARRVADVRLGLRILSGAHPRDPWSLDVPFEGPAAAGPVRVAVVSAPPGDATDPVVTAATGAAADRLADAGYDVVEACPPRYEEAVEVWSRFITWDFEAGMDVMMQLMGPGGRAFLQATRESTGAAPGAPALSALLGRRDAIAREWSLFMADHPLVLTPTWTQLPFPHGWDAASPANALGTLSLMRPVTHANLLGLPSACVPAAYDEASGLPIGVLLTGRRMRDHQCLDAAEAIEARFSLPTPIDPRW